MWDGATDCHGRAGIEFGLIRVSQAEAPERLIGRLLCAPHILVEIGQISDHSLDTGSAPSFAGLID